MADSLRTSACPGYFIGYRFEIFKTEDCQARFAQDKRLSWPFNRLSF
jgi:hypothetical protein